MSGKAVKRLFDLEIDEVSLVDRSANQHATVAIAKRDEQESDMPEPVIYDAAGDEVFDDELEHGGTYFDDDGQAYVYDETGEFADGLDDDDEDAYEDDRELALVGKAGVKPLGGNIAGDVKNYFKYGSAGNDAKVAGRKSAAWGKKNRVGLGVGAGVGATAGASVNKRQSKRESFGSTVLEELSKALGQDERDQVIGKAMDYVAIADRRANEAMRIAKGLQDQADLAEYVEIAKSYDLPGDPTVLGRVLKSAAETLTRDELIALDQVLTSAAEQALYAELGSGGNHQASSVMDEVYALAGDAVGKFDGITPEQAVTAMFEANPLAYDEYLSER